MQSAGYACRLTARLLKDAFFLAGLMLSVRREGVTDAAGDLQREGLFYYSRGKIPVVDRLGLEARVCECYQVVNTEFERLLPDSQVQ